jgi:hypothetical protein
MFVPIAAYQESAGMMSVSFRLSDHMNKHVDEVILLQYLETDNLKSL